MNWFATVIIVCSSMGLGALIYIVLFADLTEKPNQVETKDLIELMNLVRELTETIDLHTTAISMNADTVIDLHQRLLTLEERIKQRGLK